MEERLYNIVDVQMIASAMCVIDQRMMPGTDYDEAFKQIVIAYNELVKTDEDFIVLDVVKKAEGCLYE